MGRRACCSARSVERAKVTWDPERRRATALGRVRGEGAASGVDKRYAVRGVRSATACTSCSISGPAVLE